MTRCVGTCRCRDQTVPCVVQDTINLHIFQQITTPLEEEQERSCPERGVSKVFHTRDKYFVKIISVKITTDDQAIIVSLKLYKLSRCKYVTQHICT